MKQTILSLRAQKEAGEPISMLTAYDYTTAKIMDQSDIDAILIGDSLGMTMMGYSDTLPVTVDDMIVYGRSVARACENSFVIIDMPFLSYQVSVEQALTEAGRIMKETGADAVKLEGGTPIAPQIRALTQIGIPVCAHIGMTPQSHHTMGGFKVQGREELGARRLLADARAVQEAGAFAVVLECVPPDLAALITKELDIITIGIGAGNTCDGQVLVVQDMLGMNDTTPKFVRPFASLKETMQMAFREYDRSVKRGEFPTEQEAYAESGLAVLLENDFSNL